MELEYKSFIPGTETKVIDEERGIVEMIVAVTNVVDKVHDIYLPGAFEKSLAERSMKGMRGHDWSKTVGKTLEAKELRPGDARLPASLLALNAGALWIKGQYNLNTQAGRDGFEDVKFFGPDQEWSVGYKVNPAQTKTDRATGIRRIGEAEMHEWSDVPFGAMPLTATLSVKALLAEKDATAETLEHQEEENVATFEFGPFKGLTHDEVENIKERARAAAADVAFERTGKSLVPAVVVEGVLFTSERLLKTIEQCEAAKAETKIEWTEGGDVTLEAFKAGLERLEALVADRSRPEPVEVKDGRLPGSWEERQDSIRGAVQGLAQGKFGGGTYVWIIATFNDHVVAQICPGPSSNYVDTVDGDGDTEWSVPYSMDPDGNVTVGTPVEVELVSSVQVMSKVLRDIARETKAGAVLKGSNATHLTEAVLHLVAIAKSAGMSVDDLVADIKEDFADNGSDEDNEKGEPEGENKAYTVGESGDTEKPHAVMDANGKAVSKHKSKADAQQHADEMNQSKGESGDEDETKMVTLSDAESLMFEALHYDAENH